ncbi:hypothetical protein ACHHYP_11998 [Achlya hypogyna]|uniref:Uncharacterized protein n=1 Tax=Achlya hypogyna TaxID=1202772 RepID=A0A1V9YHV1_ACHHY|nr:hypothetical protein ACHHYP_11998 [Achlya hypogyna]
MRLTEAEIDKLPYHAARSFCGKHALGTKGLAVQLRRRIRIFLGYDAPADDEADVDPCSTVEPVVDSDEVDDQQGDMALSDREERSNHSKSFMDEKAFETMAREPVKRVGIAVPDLARFMNMVQASLGTLATKMDDMASTIGTLHARAEAQNARLDHIHEALQPQARLSQIDEMQAAVVKKDAVIRYLQTRIEMVALCGRCHLSTYVSA